MLKPALEVSTIRVTGNTREVEVFVVQADKKVKKRIIATIVIAVAILVATLSQDWFDKSRRIPISISARQHDNTIRRLWIISIPYYDESAAIGQQLERLGEIYGLQQVGRTQPFVHAMYHGHVFGIGNKWVHFPIMITVVECDNSTQWYAVRRVTCGDIERGIVVDSPCGNDGNSVVFPWVQVSRIVK